MRILSPLLVFGVCSCWCSCYVFGCVIFRGGFGFKMDWLIQLGFRCALGRVLGAAVFLLLIVSLRSSQRAPSATATSVAAQRLVGCCSGGLILINNCAYPAVVCSVGLADLSFFDSDTLFFNDLGLGYLWPVLRFSDLPSS